ncbi:2226_t:CDS:2, partial [Funneliformis caledonium]
MNSGNFVQEKGKGKSTTSHLEISSENASTKRKKDENINFTIAATLQELEGLSGQALLRMILENKLYTFYDDNKHVYCQSCQKPITLHHSNDGVRLKEHIITPTHIGKSQEKTDNNFIDLTESADDNDDIVLISQRNQNQKPLEMTSKDSKQYVCNGFFGSEYANDDLYNGLNRAGGYFKSIKCLEYCSKKWCYECGQLAKNEAFNRRKREYQKLNWLGRIYKPDSELQVELGLTKESGSIIAEKFPLELHLLE